MTTPRPTAKPHLFCHRFFSIGGGIFGAGGIAAYAAAHHLGEFGVYCGNLAPILLSNAPVFIALALSRTQALLPRAAGALIFFGGLLFALAMLSMEFLGRMLFPFAAPIGGMAMIIGWLLFIPAAFTLLKTE